jgi:hypothetical protein
MAGAIQDFYVSESGSYSTPPTNPVTTFYAPPLLGTGTGATFEMTWADDTPNRLHIEKYQESDFLQLGLPADLESVYA